jgi:hypothetical protein
MPSTVRVERAVFEPFNQRPQITLTGGWTSGRISDNDNAILSFMTLAEAVRRA